ncbi:hypothetical protein MMPV_000389 [Pyropia vietnamensis]
MSVGEPGSQDRGDTGLSAGRNGVAGGATGAPIGSPAAVASDRGGDAGAPAFGTPAAAAATEVAATIEAAPVTEAAVAPAVGVAMPAVAATPTAADVPPPHPPPRAPPAAAAARPSNELLTNILTGAIAGVVGQSTVFPMYVLKTAVQNAARPTTIVAAARKVVRKQGLRGLYRGLPPALVGVAPEKAIKLSMNDFFRSRLADPDTGVVSLSASVLAGAGAGLCQVVATCPMEMLMITMMTRATEDGRKPKSLFHLVRELGLPGLYRGTLATLARDVPFSMVFFSMNATVKDRLADEQGKVSIGRVFLAGITAGSTAAAMSTPMDVIKTRLQADVGAGGARPPPPPPLPPPPRPTGGAARGVPPPTATATTSRLPPAVAGTAAAALRRPYRGILDCARRVVTEEGVRALFKGVEARVMIISPLFGITLLFYEAQRRLLAAKE